MKTHLLILALCASSVLGSLAGCATGAESAPATGPAQGRLDSKTAAAVTAAGVANQSNPDGPAKVATAGEISIARAALPEPSAADRAEALARINLALQGKIEAYQAEAAQAAGAMRTLKGTLDAERGQASAAIDRLTVELEQERKTKLALIFGGIGAALVVLGAVLGVVSAFTSDVAAVSSKLKFAAGIAGAAGTFVGSVPIFWDSAAFPWVCGVVATLAIGAVVWFGREAWKSAKANKDAVRASVAQTVTESALAHETLLLLAGQIDKLKKTDSEAAKKLTDMLATTFDSDNEQLIDQVRGQALADG